MTKDYYLNKEINIFISYLKNTTFLSKQKYKQILTLIISDLKKVNQLPSTFKNLNNDNIQSLVNYWYQKKLSPNTILSRVGCIRLLLLNTFKKEILTNSDFGIKIKSKPRKKYILNANIIDWVHHPITKSIIAFQIYFGLTKSEAIKIHLDSSVQDDDLIVTRLIAFNSKDRYIPILNNNQREALSFRRNILLKSGTLDEKMPLSLILSLYRAEIYDFNLKHDDNLRKLYAQDRLSFLLLKKNKTERQAKTILKEELGFSNITNMARFLI